MDHYMCKEDWIGLRSAKSTPLINVHLAGVKRGTPQLTERKMRPLNEPYLGAGLKQKSNKNTEPKKHAKESKTKEFAQEAAHP
eukprot:176909-Amphidinium_carterae.1